MATIRLGTPGDLARVAALEAAADTAVWLAETGLAWHERARALHESEGYGLAAAPSTAGQAEGSGGLLVMELTVR